MDILYQSQKELSGRISRSFSNFQKIGKVNMTATACQTRLDQLERDFSSFLSAHDKFVALPGYEEHDYTTTALFEGTQENYFDLMDKFKTHLIACQTPATLDATIAPPVENNTAAAPNSVNSLVSSLPAIHIPKFNGALTEWARFRDLFISLVHNRADLPPVVKFYHLTALIEGDAQIKIKNLDVTADNYQVAWNTLTEFYENKRRLINHSVGKLFSLKSMKTDNYAEIEKLFSGTFDIVGFLESLGRSVETNGVDLIVWLTVSKFDPTTRREWEKTLGDSTQPTTLAELKKFLRDQMATLESIEAGSRSPNLSNQKTSSPKTHTVSTDSEAQNSAQKVKPCASCGEAHKLHSCNKFKSLSPIDRLGLVKTKNFCFQCLGNHSFRNCKSKHTCAICKKRHHVLLHEGLVTLKSSSKSDVQNTSVSHHSSHPQLPGLNSNAETFKPSQTPQQSMNTVRPDSFVLLPTAWVKIEHQGRTHYFRALIDQASQVSLVTENCCQKLFLPRSRSSVSVEGVSSQYSEKTKGRVSLNIRSLVHPDFVCEIDAWILNRITNYRPLVSPELATLPHLSSIDLADPEFFNHHSIDLLLGADVHAKIISNEVTKGASNEPIASNTKLGWIVSGISTDSAATSSRSCHLIDNLSLIKAVEKFWSLEEVTAPESPYTEDEKICESHFVETHSRNEHGRYVVRLPFDQQRVKTHGLNFEGSFNRAHAVLRSLRSKFKDPIFAQRYCDFIREYELLGHMSLVSPLNTVQQDHAFYLPHHGVCNSRGKLRTVFNGSTRVGGGLSLNDFLLPGCNLIPDLSTLISRWRMYPFVFTTDVVKMFRQILVHPEDRHFQLVLWYPQNSNTLQTFALNTVTYGLRCSPFLAIRSLLQLASDEGRRFELAAEIVRKESYVDDFITGAFSIGEGRRKQKELVSLLELGGFKLGKWAANTPDLLECIEAGSRATESPIFEEFQSTSVLGLSWSPTGDYFHFNINLEIYDPSKLTKRTALSMCAKLFDPLGFLSPVTINSKVFIKSLWLLKCSWDSPLPRDYRQRWENFYAQLSVLAELEIPRWIGFRQEGQLVELHGFADASLRAYGAVLYLRVLQGSGVTITLLCSKTKVSPNISVPRLELCAAHLLTKLTKNFLSSSSLGILKVHLWSDSKDVLYWIQDHPSRWQTFVANRCHEIQTLVPEACWHHVKGSQNPADLISRGVSPGELKDLKLWWQGPEFLHATHAWPEEAEMVQTVPKEERRAKPVVLTVTANSNDMLTRFSSLPRLLRVTGWCLRFLGNLLRRLKSNLPHRLTLTRYLPTHDITIDNKELTPKELKNSELLWVSVMQHTHFADEVTRLENGQKLEKSPLLKLNPWLDEGLLRVGGRLQHSQLDHDEKHPWILPARCHLTLLLIRDAHRRSLHGGTQLTLSTLRCRYWLLKGRQQVGSVIGSCVTCRRHAAKITFPSMANLPSDRVCPAPPFENSGIDYAGPYKLRLTKSRGKGTMKAWIAVFTCLSTRAVHLELVEDYTTDAFLAAFSRFTSRRGQCALLRSDQGPNLVGADAELRKMFKEASKQMAVIIPALATMGTKWVFNPPSAPHFGGVWESVVKSAKFHLRRVVGEHVLNYAEFTTLLCRVEACLNSRPLGKVSDDADDGWVLTPAHFLIQRPSFIVPEPYAPKEHVPIGKRWAWLKQLFQVFWSKWSQGYLRTLQERQKWYKATRNLQVDDLVLIKDDNHPPAQWPMGRVIKVYHGSENQVRVVDVKTEASVYTRPAAKLILLVPVDDLTSKDF